MYHRSLIREIRKRKAPQSTPGLVSDWLMRQRIFVPPHRGVPIEGRADFVQMFKGLSQLPVIDGPQVMGLLSRRQKDRCIAPEVDHFVRHHYRPSSLPL